MPLSSASAASAKPGHAVIRVLGVTLFLNVVNFALKFAVGFFTGNLTVISDALHGLIDGANNVVGMVALKISFKPPDHNHPYGHRKFEALASLAIGGFMTMTCWELLKHIAGRLWHGGDAASAATPLDLSLIGAGMLVNVGCWLYEARAGRRLNSPLLIADASHTKSDVLVTMMSFSSLLLAPKVPGLDALLSLLIAGLILRTGWVVVRDNVLLLTDAMQIDPAPVRRVVEKIPGVRNCHAIRSHGMPDEVHLDLHIVVDPDLSAADTEKIEKAVREGLLREFPQIAEVAIHHQTGQPVTAQPIRRENVMQQASAEARKPSAEND